MVEPPKPHELSSMTLMPSVVTVVPPTHSFVLDPLTMLFFSVNAWAQQVIARAASPWMKAAFG